MKAFKLFLFVLLLLVVALISYWAISPANSPSWTGFDSYDEVRDGPRAKTLWDWLDLLIVPLFISLSVWLLSAAQKHSEAKRQENQHRQQTLESYLDRMSHLLLKSHLRSSRPSSEVRRLARNWSLVAFRTLDGDRKAETMQFLYESRLIDKKPVIDLLGANLRNCNLSNAVLKGAQIRGAYLSATNMHGANLQYADLRGSDLSNTDLRYALLQHANLTFALLNRANLRNTDLSMTLLRGADLTKAKLWRTVISDQQREVMVLSRRQIALLRAFSYFRKQPADNNHPA
jgi:hypothetical protein